MFFISLLPHHYQNVGFFFFFAGGYDMEEKAARAYDLAALKYWGASTHINFTVIGRSIDALLFLLNLHFIDLEITGLLFK